MANKVMIKEVVDYFQLEQVVGDEHSLNRWIIVPDLNRPGLELAGYYDHMEPRRVIIIGAKEQDYIDTLSLEVQRQRFEHITDGYTPMIILTHNKDCPKVLQEIAERVNFPIFKSKQASYQMMVECVQFLAERLALTDTLHGVLMNINGKGVLIQGRSGMGKSEIALELISRGHTLVADDRVDVKNVNSVIYGQPAELLKGMLEIRGIGIVDVAKMFGHGSLIDNERIELVIHLEDFNPNTEYNRVGIEDAKYTNILGIDIPTIVIPVIVGRPMAVLVEAAVTNLTLKLKGFDSAKEFEQRTFAYIEKNRKLGE